MLGLRRVLLPVRVDGRAGNRLLSESSLLPFRSLLSLWTFRLLAGLVRQRPRFAGHGALAADEGFLLGRARSALPGGWKGGEMRGCRLRRRRRRLALRCHLDCGQVAARRTCHIFGTGVLAGHHLRSRYRMLKMTLMAKVVRGFRLLRQRTRSEKKGLVRLHVALGVSAGISSFAGTEPQAIAFVRFLERLCWPC